MSILVTDPHLAPSNEEFEAARRIEAAFARKPTPPRRTYPWFSKQLVSEGGDGGLYEAGECVNGWIALLVGRGGFLRAVRAGLWSGLRERLPQRMTAALLGEELNRLFGSIRSEESEAPSKANSMFLALIDPVRKLLAYFNTGEGSSWVWTGSTGLTRLKPTGDPLGMEPEMDIPMESLALDQAHRAIVFQAMNSEPGGTWIRSACEETAHLPVDEQVDSLLSSIRGGGSAPNLGGDVTVLGVDFGPGSAYPVRASGFPGHDLWTAGGVDPCVFLG